MPSPLVIKGACWWCTWPLASLGGRGVGCAVAPERSVPLIGKHRAMGEAHGVGAEAECGADGTDGEPHHRVREEPHEHEPHQPEEEGRARQRNTTPSLRFARCFAARFFSFFFSAALCT